LPHERSGKRPLPCNMHDQVTVAMATAQHPQLLPTDCNLPALGVGYSWALIMDKADDGESGRHGRASFANNRLRNIRILGVRTHNATARNKKKRRRRRRRENGRFAGNCTRKLLTRLSRRERIETRRYDVTRTSLCSSVANWTIRRQTNSRSVKSRTGQLVDLSTRRNVLFQVWSI